MIKINSILALMWTSTILLIFAIIVGGFYMIETSKQSKANTADIAKINATLINFLDRFQDAQEKGNVRGNITIEYFKALFNQVLDSEHNIIGNLSDHRRITNISRDAQIDLLHQILNQTKH